MAKVSEILGLSEQQLYRKLSAISVKFSDLCSLIICEKAITLIEQAYSIETVAKLVGYPNVASFNRLFKQGIGVTPYQYRLQNIE